MTNQDKDTKDDVAFREIERAACDFYYALMKLAGKRGGKPMVLAVSEPMHSEIRALASRHGAHAWQGPHLFLGSMKIERDGDS